jgi:hypothetical protein
VASKTDAQVVTAIGEYVVDLMTEMNAEISTGVELQKVECFVEASLLFEPIGVGTPTWAGTAAGDRVPSGVALLVRAFKERSGYADKKFLMGFVESAIASDYWISSTLTAAEAYAALWIAQYTGSDSTILLPVSYRPSDGLMRPYTSAEVSSISSYQRRRKPGVGLT